MRGLLRELQFALSVHCVSRRSTSGFGGWYLAHDQRGAEVTAIGDFPARLGFSSLLLSLRVSSGTRDEIPAV